MNEKRKGSESLYNRGFEVVINFVGAVSPAHTK